MPAVRDQAICVRVWDWSETSQTVALFARGLGMLRAVAKGSRRSDSRFSGGLEVTTRGEMLAIVKPAERSPEAMAMLTAWNLEEVFPPVRTSLSSFRAAMYMMDVLYHALRDADPHPELFDAALDSLRSLGTGDAVAVLGFQWAVLDTTGHRPDLEIPHHLTGRPPYFEYSPRLGVIVAPGTRNENGSAEETWRIRPETVSLVTAVAQARGSRSLAGAAASGETVERANRFLAHCLRAVLGAWPPSVRDIFPGITGSEV